MCALTIAMFALTPSFLLNYAGDNLLRTRGALSQSLPIFIIVIVNSIFVFQVAMARRQRWTFRLQVKLPFSHLLTTRDKAFTLSLNANRQAGKLWIPIFIVFGLTLKSSIIILIFIACC